jgi:hypothetical protein
MGRLNVPAAILLMAVCSFAFATRATAANAGIPGTAMPAQWHFERIDDRLALDGDGLCTLTRTFSLVIDDSPRPLRSLRILVPTGFATVDRVADAQGNPLKFKIEWVDDLRQLSLVVPTLERGVPTTFSVLARGRHLVVSSSAGEAVINYAPGPFQARVQTLHVELAGPAGQTASLDRTGVPPGYATDVVLRATIPASGLTERDAPTRSYTRDQDLRTLAIVIASILGGLFATIIALRRRLKERADRLILVAALTTGALLFLSPILLEDNLSYYAWGRSAVFDHDMDRMDEFGEFNQSLAFTPDNREAQDPIFAPLFDVPFIAAASGLTRIVNAIGPAHAPNGFSFPYLFLTALGDFFAVLLGCLACFSLVERRVGRRYALFSVLAVLGGTNLLLFAYAWTGGSYQPSFLLFAVFLDRWDKTRDARTRGDWFVAGVLMGLLAMTRTLNLGLVLIPFLDWSIGAAARLRKDGLPGLSSEVGLGTVFTSGMLVGYAPQLVVQRIVDQALALDVYGVSRGRFSGLRENIGPLFVSPTNGLFTAMPLIALAFLGLAVLFRNDRRLGAVLTATMAAQLLAIGSYEIYWGRFLYGTPYLVPCTPILCLGMASLMQAVESRWTRVGRPLLWGATAFCAARNAWCVFMILARKMAAPTTTHWDFADIVHALYLPGRKLDVDVLRPVTEFGCIVREIVGGLRAWDYGRLLGALGWASLVIIPVVVAYPATVLIRRWAARVSPTVLRRVAVSALALIWLGTMGWVAALASRTDLNYNYEIVSHLVGSRAFAVQRVEPGQSYTVSFHLTNALDRFSVITFLDGAADVPQGERVATVEFVGAGAAAPVELRAGIDTADFEADRPESRSAGAHTAPLDRACFSWRVNDDSSLFYTARAYRTVLTPPSGTRPTAIKVTSSLAHGAVDVLVGTARERNLSKGSPRRRAVPAPR